MRQAWYTEKKQGGGESFGGVLLSMNQPQAAQIVLNEGEDGETSIAIDPDQPFAYILPEGTEILTLYDQRGQMVPLAGVEIF